MNIQRDFKYKNDKNRYRERLGNLAMSKYQNIMISAFRISFKLETLRICVESKY